ncbi:MAG: SUMF1/EgtB/PvdO family nonheme iron enzyme [Sulfurovum sp.]|nr:SUMF1/EgtB/PvdO family nonheme iron enzyme [Sulfurovum sp.]
MKIVYVSLSFILIVLLSACASKTECKNPLLAKANIETMSFVTGGKFIMGTKNDAFSDKPLKGVYVSSFFLDKSEVSNAMYKEYIAEKECANPPKYLEDPILGADEFPVVDVSYKEAKGFCSFYGKRLPTEAEWEYAARGKLKNKEFPWGNGQSQTLMNYRGSNNTWAVAVKSYPPNKYGLYDMSGNVREWVVDTYTKDFYTCAKRSKMDKVINAIDRCRVNPINKSQGQFKVNRGGSWHYTEGFPSTVSFRSFDISTARYSDLGFRCANDGRQDNILEQNINSLKAKFKESLGAEIPSDLPIDMEQLETENAMSSNFDDLSADSIDISQVSSMASSQLGVAIPPELNQLVDTANVEDAL